jgi:hypothetical protein
MPIAEKPAPGASHQTLDTAEQQQNDDDEEDQPDPASWVVPPPAAVAPPRQGTNQQQDENYDEDRPEHPYRYIASIRSCQAWNSDETPLYGPRWRREPASGRPRGWSGPAYFSGAILVSIPLGVLRSPAQPLFA